MQPERIVVEVNSDDEDEERFSGGEIKVRSVDVEEVSSLGKRAQEGEVAGESAKDKDEIVEERRDIRKGKGKNRDSRGLTGMTTTTGPYPIPISGGEIRRSMRNRRAPVKDDNDRYSKSSYSRKTTVEDVPDETSPTASAIVHETANVPNETAHIANAPLPDPKTYDEAMSRPDAIHWKLACIVELEQFIKQKLYTTVPKPEGRKVMGCKWVFKTKLGPDGQIEQYKAHLMAQGFSQVEGIDYDETFPLRDTKHSRLF